MSNTDATTKIIGFQYQKLVALLKSFEAKDHTNIYIECYGDVSDVATSTEVKHSINRSKKLINTHIDFWKTIGNIVDDLNSFSAFSTLILHTTAQVKDDSIFHDWHNLTPKEKSDRVLSVKPTETIRKHYDKVKKCSVVELRKILDKFVIEHSKYGIKDYYNLEILEHPIITTAVIEEHREPIVERLIGYIDSILIKSEDNDYIWKINIDNFRSVFQSELKKYIIDDYIFPIVKKQDVIDDDVSNFNFIQRLKEIGYDDMISFATSDYLRAQSSRIKMIQDRWSLSEELDNYDEDVSDEMNLTRVQHNSKIEDIDGKDYINKKSRELYDDCINKSQSRTSIEGVKGVRDYYPKGRIHFNVEEYKGFSWSLKKIEDES